MFLRATLICDIIKSFREQAIDAAMSIGLTEDEAERAVEDYMDSEYL